MTREIKELQSIDGKLVDENLVPVSPKAISPILYFYLPDATSPKLGIRINERAKLLMPKEFDAFLTPTTFNSFYIKPKSETGLVSNLIEWVPSKEPYIIVPVQYFRLEERVAEREKLSEDQVPAKFTDGWFKYFTQSCIKDYSEK